MSPTRVDRRLAAILAADVAGYSRLIGAHEEGTLAALKAIRAELTDPKIAEHRGRIVKTTGDGLLVEFASVVDAEVDAPLGRNLGIARGHPLLHRDSAAHRIDHARKFQQQPVASGLDDPPAVFGDLRVNKLPPVGFQSRQGGAVVAAHEQGIAHYVGRYDRRQSSVVPCQARPL